jgi:hypothetical protein
MTYLRLRRNSHFGEESKSVITVDIVQFRCCVGSFATTHVVCFVHSAPGIHCLFAAQIKQICLIAFIVDLRPCLSAQPRPVK